MAEPDDKFLARWSQRKRRAEAETQAPEKAAPPAEAAEAAEVPPAVPSGTPPEETPEEARQRLGLPEIESLEDSSDFAQFMAEGVPEVLRRRALRRLWRLNPIYANLDGLAEYDEDFRDVGALAAGIKTVYKVGKGMFDKEETAAAPPSDAAPQVGEEAASGESPPAAEAESAAEPPPEEAPLGEASQDPEEGTEEAPLDTDEAPQATPEPSRTAARRRWGDSEG